MTLPFSGAAWFLVGRRATLVGIPQLPDLGWLDTQVGDQLVPRVSLKCCLHLILECRATGRGSMLWNIQGHDCLQHPSAPPGSLAPTDPRWGGGAGP